MSLDLALVIDTGGPGLATVWDGWNYTSNVNPMWRAVLPGGADLGEYLRGKKAKTTLPTLRKALAAMTADPARFEAMNPENGWGSYGHAVVKLGQLVEAAERNPKATWRACW